MGMRGVPNLVHRTIKVPKEICFGFQIGCSLSKPDPLNAKFYTFLLAVKIGE